MQIKLTVLFYHIDATITILVSAITIDREFKPQQRNPSQ